MVKQKVSFLKKQAVFQARLSQKVSGVQNTLRGTTKHDRGEINLPLTDLRYWMDDWVLEARIQQISPNTVKSRVYITGRLVWWLEQQNKEQCGADEMRGFFAYIGTVPHRWDNPSVKTALRAGSLRLYYVRLQTFNLDDAIRDYLRYAEAVKNLTPKTMEPYQSWLRHLSLWLKDNDCPNPTLQDFNTTNLQNFYYYCREERQHRPRTVRGAFAPLRGFGDYLVHIKAIPTNPAKEIDLPKKDAAERVMVSDQQLMTLWDACKRIYPTRRAVLTRAVLACFIYGGLRSFEALALKERDVETEPGGNRVLIRHGKGEKSRSVFLPEVGMEAIRAWQAIRSKDGWEHEWLWMTGPKRHLGENGLAYMMKEVRAAAGLSEETYITPHSIRHNFATRLLRNGANIRDVQVRSDMHTWIQQPCTFTSMRNAYAPLLICPPSSTLPLGSGIGGTAATRVSATASPLTSSAAMEKTEEKSKNEPNAPEVNKMPQEQQPARIVNQAHKVRIMKRK